MKIWEAVALLWNMLNVKLIDLKGPLADTKFTDTIRGSILSAYCFGASDSICMSVYY